MAAGAIAVGWSIAPGAGAPPGGLPGAQDAPSRASAQKLFERLPVRFEANRGQASGKVDFLARGPGYSVSLGRDGAVLALRNRGAAAAGAAGSSAVVGMHLVGGNPRPEVAGADRLAGTSNYLNGADRRDWHTNVPSFARVRYSSVYPGVDMVYRGNQRELEYDFIVAPGIDPGQIALGFRGSDRLSVTKRGDLLIHAGGGAAVRQRRPVIYQGSGADRRRIEGSYALQPNRRVGFEIGAYDRSKPLVIDPTIAYSTHLGGYNTEVGIGSSQDRADGITVDSEGNAYVVGFTDSIEPNPYPNTPGAFQTEFAGGSRDAFVTKLNASGDGAVYSTYLGGSAEDRATDVEVGSDGKAYVSGLTVSTDFPTQSPLQPTYGGGGRDAFVAVLNAAGSDLVYSTYLGGSGTDTANRLALGSAGAAYVGGTTSPASRSTTNDFPTTAGSFQPTFGGGDGPTAPGDAFVSKVSPTGDALTYSTFLGGTGSDSGSSIAVDSTGAAYLTGGTRSTTVFGSAGAFQTAPQGEGDAYVAKLNPAGSALDYGTYLGSASSDSGTGVAVDSAGNAYVTGTTDGTTFPTKNAFQPENASAPGPFPTDAFVTKLNAAGSDTVYSTYLGSNTFDSSTDIAVDSSNSAYATGNSLGTFPLKNPVQVRTGDYEGWLTKFDPAGDVTYSTTYGGGSRDFSQAVAADNSGSAYIAGRTDYFAPDAFPVKNAFQPRNGGFADAWAAKIDATPTSPLVNSLRSRGGPPRGGTSVVIRGTGFTGTSQVSFGGTTAASFTVDSDSQITAVSPAHAAGKVAVTVTAPSGTSPANPVSEFTFAEGVWKETGSLNRVHYDAQVERLFDGRVLMIGGQNAMFGDTIASTEVYDPKTRTWSDTDDLNTPRSAYSVTRLNGPACRSDSPPAYCGDLLVAGGSPGNTAAPRVTLATAETYDGATGTWTDTAGDLETARAQHAATLLDGPECHASSPPDYCGKVLVSGGYAYETNTPLNSAELYDPATGQWTTTEPLQHANRQTASVLLKDGRVLLPGGSGTDRTQTEIYDPAGGSWSVTGSMNVGRERHSVVVLEDGKVLAAAGVQPGDPPYLDRPLQAGDSAELYDPATGEWTLLPDRLTTGARNNHDSALLPSGKVMLAGGGRGGLYSEVFDPADNMWTSAGFLNLAHGSGHPQHDSYDTVVLSSGREGFEADSAACGDDCGKVLIAGNNDEGSAELYTPPPVVSGLAPAAGGAGTSVTITGQGFTHNVSAVLFGTTPAASFSVDSYGQITAVAPAGSGAVQVTVVNDGGQASSAGTFTLQPGTTPGGGGGGDGGGATQPGGGGTTPPGDTDDDATPARVRPIFARPGANARQRGRRVVVKVTGRLVKTQGRPCKGRVAVGARTGGRKARHVFQIQKSGKGPCTYRTVFRFRVKKLRKAVRSRNRRLLVRVNSSYKGTRQLTGDRAPSVLKRVIR